MPEDKSIRIVLDPDDMQGAQDAARSIGVDLTVEAEPQLIPAVVAVLIAGGALAVAHFVVDLVDRLHGGIIIDLRPNAEAFVTRNRDVPYGWAVVRAADGTVSINVHDAPKDATERLITSIVNNVFDSATELAKAAAKELGPDRVKHNK
jgi:hypothetical protein